jgi:hypothetical protein
LQSETGTGIAIRGLIAGGQAEATQQVSAGDVVTHINGVDVTTMLVTEIMPLIKSVEEVTFRFSPALTEGEGEGDTTAPAPAPDVAAAAAAAVDPDANASATTNAVKGEGDTSCVARTAGRTVAFDRSRGRSLGMRMMPNPATGLGIAVERVLPREQAEGTKQVFDGDVITHINGADVSQLPVMEALGVIKKAGGNSQLCPPFCFGGTGLSALVGQAVVLRVPLCTLVPGVRGAPV